ncbi:MAG: uroporphyrinogen-III synthase [Oleiphilaceae bacterium]|nr:uroporphyrinogen-III synthase [Oleiphilaceae bacterium]
MSESLPQLFTGTRILVCRPHADAEPLANALSATGASVHCLPCLEIVPIEPDSTQRQYIIDLDQYSHVLVTSQYAAQPMLEWIDTYWPQLPVGQQWFGIGRKTSAVLEQFGLSVHKNRRDLDSEALLKLPELQDLREKKVLLVKGKNGRQVLQQELSNRSARVDTLELYERRRPSYGKEQLRQALNEFRPNWVICLSAETIENLHGYAREIDYDIQVAKVIVPSKRVAQVAKSLGFKLTYVTDKLMPIDIIRCLKNARD